MIVWEDDQAPKDTFSSKGFLLRTLSSFSPLNVPLNSYLRFSTMIWICERSFIPLDHRFWTELIWFRRDFILNLLNLHDEHKSETFNSWRWSLRISEELISNVVIHILLGFQFDLIKILIVSSWRKKGKPLLESSQLGKTADRCCRSLNQEIFFLTCVSSFKKFRGA